MSAKRTVYKIDWRKICVVCTWIVFLTCIVGGPILIKRFRDRYKGMCVGESYSAGDFLVPVATLLLTEVLLIVGCGLVRQTCTGTLADNAYFMLGTFCGFFPLVGCTLAAFGIFIDDSPFKNCVLSNTNILVLIVATYFLYGTSVLGLVVVYVLPMIGMGIVWTIRMMSAQPLKLWTWLKSIVQVENEPA